VPNLKDAIHEHQYAVRYLWNIACQHDEIEPDALLIAFSDDNPFIPAYNKAMADLQVMMVKAKQAIDRDIARSLIEEARRNRITFTFGPSEPAF
jgi:hypothetical protein